ncbi:MAG: CHAT domain-containing protein [Crenarchaeota archaeon]|nr:CHAT domain-containing protein [Thermoproteota archaeon]
MVKYKSPAEKAWITRKTELKKIQNGLTILDCTVKSREGCSEGEYLWQYLKILNRQRDVCNFDTLKCFFTHCRCSVKGKYNLQENLRSVPTSTIHISGHGNINKQTGETYLYVGNGALELKHLKGIWSDRDYIDKPLLIVLSACNAGHKDLIEAFSNEGCRYLIAPVFETDWHKAALFSSLLYTYLFLGEINGNPLKAHPLEVITAFRKAKGRLPELTGYWKLFEYGQEKS